MFRVNRDGGTSGVTLTFANGASLSVQSSTSHMCTPGHSVEIHAWGPGRVRLNLKGRDDIVGFVRMDDLPKFMNKVKRWKPSAKCGATAKNPCTNPHCRRHGREVA